MRAAALSTADAHAGAATERMGLPLVVLLTGFLIFLFYPALVAVLQI
jgi:hypothetical protein